MPEHGDEQPVGVGRVDVDLRDHLRVVKAKVRPRLARVSRLVHAVARRQVGANDSGARADVDDVRVGRRHGNRANRAAAGRVEDRLPVRAVVGRAPHAAVVEADVRHVRLTRHAGHGARTARTCGSDLAPVHGGREFRRLRARHGRDRCGGNEKQGGANGGSHHDEVSLEAIGVVPQRWTGIVAFATTLPLPQVRGRFPVRPNATLGVAAPYSGHRT